MSLDELLRNFTSATARVFLVDHWSGAEVILIVAKQVYAVADDGTVSELDEPRPIRLHDVLYAGADSSIRYPSDLVDDKPGTDVVLVGTAQPPALRTVQSMSVSLSVARGSQVSTRSVIVHGQRVWYRGLGGVVPGPAADLAPTPLRYEQAYGGRDDSRDPPLIDWRNPCGSGIAHDRTALLGKPTHSIEDPEDPRVPAGFGAVAAHWRPRAQFAGSYDAAWRQQRAPLRPRDFNPRHNSCASAGLWFDSPLTGTEPFEITGVRPDRPWRFSLPGFAPLFRCDAAGAAQPLPSHLDTLLIDADHGCVELVWRASLRAPRKLERIDGLRILSRSERYFSATSNNR